MHVFLLLVKCRISVLAPAKKILNVYTRDGTLISNMFGLAARRPVRVAVQAMQHDINHAGKGKVNQAAAQIGRVVLRYFSCILCCTHFGVAAG